MPIKGMTDNVQPRFPRLGKLRKGMLKEKVRNDGKTVYYPVDLDHFRFTSEQPEVEQAFQAAFGEAPSAVLVGTQMVAKGHDFPGVTLVAVLLADADRAQRNTVALLDVDYVIEARFELTERAGKEDNRAKFVDMFHRRVERGQHFHQPYLGCREFVADVRPVDADIPQAIDETRDLGLMLYDLDYSPGQNRPLFFPARLNRGVLEIPADLAPRQAAGGAS